MGESVRAGMRIIILGLLAILISCGAKTPEKPKLAPKLPKITHFHANQSVVPNGGSVTLCYGTENVETLTLTPYEEGELRPSFNRCVADAPGKDTIYTLTANGPGGQTTATVSIKVGSPAPKERVLIQNFQVLGNTPIRPGGRVQLCYSTQEATGVSIHPRVAAELTLGRNQCVAVSPQKTTSYILTATGADGAVDRMQVNVPVH